MGVKAEKAAQTAGGGGECGSGVAIMGIGGDWRFPYWPGGGQRNVIGHIGKGISPFSWKGIPCPVLPTRPAPGEHGCSDRFEATRLRKEIP